MLTKKKFDEISKQEILAQRNDTDDYMKKLYCDEKWRKINNKVT